MSDATAKKKKEYLKPAGSLKTLPGAALLCVVVLVLARGAGTLSGSDYSQA